MILIVAVTLKLMIKQRLPFDASNGTSSGRAILVNENLREMLNQHYLLTLYSLNVQD